MSEVDDTQAPDLTTAEQEAAKRAGMSPQQYEAMKGVRTFEDWQAARRRLAEVAQ